ncbi:hypothetical protein HYY27_01935 [bacterium]|nr:hypothetical protein [bacterium]
MVKKKKRKFITDPERLRQLIEEATVDCYGEEEQISGVLTSVEDNVVCPFRAKVIGEEVEVISLEWSDLGNNIKALCKYKGKTYPVDISSLEWVDPLPEGFEWAEAYFAWCKGI